VVGSGPAGLAAAQQLARAGHAVTVFEKSDRVGGLMRYGIPDFKFAKPALDRRLAQLRAEGVEFQTGVNVGVDLSARYLRRTFDATLLALGAGVARDVKVPGRDEARNILFAMDFLTQQNRINAGDAVDPAERVDAAGKVVLVIGGGDTGSDCVGTSIRQGARAVHQIEVLDRPPEEIDSLRVWPLWPRILRTSSSHEEGCDRRWGVVTKAFDVADGRATTLHAVQGEWVQQNGRLVLNEKPGSAWSLPVDLVLLAAGFVHVQHDGIVAQLELTLDARGNIVHQGYQTSVPEVFCAGDCERGASLVVHAINGGREAAAAMDRWLAAR
jgi:glutamate synthase (NADPH/NADH) small chain